MTADCAYTQGDPCLAGRGAAIHHHRRQMRPLDNNMRPTSADLEELVESNPAILRVLYRTKRMDNPNVGTSGSDVLVAKVLSA